MKYLVRWRQRVGLRFRSTSLWIAPQDDIVTPSRVSFLSTYATLWLKGWATLLAGEGEITTLEIMTWDAGSYRSVYWDELYYEHGIPDPTTTPFVYAPVHLYAYGRKPSRHRLYGAPGMRIHNGELELDYVTVAEAALTLWLLISIPSAGYFKVVTKTGLNTWHDVYDVSVQQRVRGAK